AAPLTHQTLRAWSPLSRNAGEDAERDEAGGGGPSVETFLLDDTLDRPPPHHPVQMRCAVCGEIHTQPLRPPGFQTEQRRIRSRDLIARDVVLACERLVEHGEALVYDLTPRRLNGVLIGREALRAEQPCKTLPVHRADGVFHRLHCAYVRLLVLRQQIRL